MSVIRFQLSVFSYLSATDSGGRYRAYLEWHVAKRKSLFGDQ